MDSSPTSTGPLGWKSGPNCRQQNVAVEMSQLSLRPMESCPSQWGLWWDSSHHEAAHALGQLIALRTLLAHRHQYLGTYTESGPESHPPSHGFGCVSG